MSELTVEKMFSETYYFFLLLKVLLDLCLLPGNLLFLFDVFPSYAFLLPVIFFRDPLELCFNGLCILGSLELNFLWFHLKLHSGTLKILMLLLMQSLVLK